MGFWTRRSQRSRQLGGNQWTPTRRGVLLRMESLESRWLLSGLPGDVISGWAFGGNAFDDARAVAVDHQGNLIVAGTSFSAGWPSGGFDTTWGGEGDAYVAKFSPDGQHLWSTYLGGESDDGAAALAVDDEGYVYVAGWTRCSGWVSGGYDTTYGGAGDGFLAKLSPEGDYLWATYLGGSNWDGVSALCLTSDGKLFVAGTTSSSGWIRKGFDTTYNGGAFDGFAALLTTDGEFLWSTYLGGTGWDYGYAVAADETGLYVAGKTSSSNWVAKGFDLTYAGGNFDGYLVRLSATGQHIWSTYLGDSGEDAAVALTTEGGTIYVVGDTTSPNLPFPGIGQSTGGQDGFVVALSSGGQCLWGTRLGGEATDQSRAVLSLGESGILVVGTTESDGWLSGGEHVVRSGTTDGFIVRLSQTSGEILWGSYFGGLLNDVPLAVTPESKATVVVAGMTYQADWLPDDLLGNSLGDADGFVARIRVNQPPAIGALMAERTMVAASSLIQFYLTQIVDHDGAEDLAGVLFYQDANGDGLWDENDRLLGQTDQVVGGMARWTLDLSVGDWPIGRHRVFALALDCAGQLSPPAVLDLTVTKLVDLGIVDEISVTENELSAGVVVFHFVATHDAFLTLSANEDLTSNLAFALYEINPLDSNGLEPLATADLTVMKPTAEIACLEAGRDYYLVVEAAASEASWTMMNLHHYDPLLRRHTFWDSKKDDVFELSWYEDSFQGMAARVMINGREMILPLGENNDGELCFFSTDGLDTMSLEDTAADDYFTAWLDQVILDTGGPRVEATRFTYVHAYARNGGMDRATFYDTTSAGDKTAKIKVKSEPQFSHVKMLAPQTSVRAKFFESVEVFADGGGDTAIFYDSPRDDTFMGSLNYGRMTGPGYDVTVWGFPFIWAYSKNGGYDRVRFVDSVMKDEFSFKPHKSELFDQVSGGSIYHIVARGFDHILAEVTTATGQRNKAAVWDTLFSDDIEASGNRLTLSRTTSHTEQLLEIRGFEFVKIRSSTGGDDRITIRQPLEMELTIGEGWQII